jgi:hypothetical protein
MRSYDTLPCYETYFATVNKNDFQTPNDTQEYSPSKFFRVFQMVPDNIKIDILFNNMNF